MVMYRSSNVNFYLITTVLQVVVESEVVVQVKYPLLLWVNKQYLLYAKTKFIMILLLVRPKCTARIIFNPHIQNFYCISSICVKKLSLHHEISVLFGCQLPPFCLLIGCCSYLKSEISGNDFNASFLLAFYKKNLKSPPLASFAKKCS